MNLAKRFERIVWWKKFACLGLLYVALIIAPIWLYWCESDKLLVSTNKEQQGLQPIQLILNIIQRTQQHRALAARFLQDISISKSTQRAKAEELEAAIFSYEIYLDKNPNADYREAFTRTVGYWHTIHQTVSQKKIDYGESFQMHSALVEMQLQYMQSLVDYYRLSLDPNAGTYLLIDASLIQLPELVEAIGKIRGYGLGLLAKGNATTDERAQLTALVLLADEKIKSLDSRLRKLESMQQKNSEIYKNYEPLKVQYQNLRGIVQAEILEKEEFSYSTENFYSALTSTINGYYGYIHFAIDKLDVDLSERIHKAKNERYKVLFVILCAILILMIIGVRLVRRLSQRLGGEPEYLAEIIKAISRGDLDSEIEIKHPDSLLATIKHMQQALRDSDRAKSAYIATASHELKTPLNAISSALSLSVNGQLGLLPEPAKTYLGVAQKNSLRLGKLIDDFLDVDKLSVAKLELDKSVQPLMPIIEDAKLSMTTYAQKYGVRISMGPRFEYLLVNVDARRLRQALKNLLSNAAKFSNKGEEIIINTTVHFDKVRIEIIDHGCGIEDERKDALFEKYSGSEDSTSTGAMGLAIAKELVLAMGGELGFTSTVGVGSCFYIDLPLEEPNSD
ncbi:MAG: ATP-binding protein [Cellvibrio sp.]